MFISSHFWLFLLSTGEGEPMSARLGGLTASPPRRRHPLPLASHGGSRRGQAQPSPPAGRKLPPHPCSSRLPCGGGRGLLPWPGLEAAAAVADATRPPPPPPQLDRFFRMPLTGLLEHDAAFASMACLGRARTPGRSAGGRLLALRRRRCQTAQACREDAGVWRHKRGLAARSRPRPPE